MRTNNILSGANKCTRFTKPMPKQSYRVVPVSSSGFSAPPASVSAHPRSDPAVFGRSPDASSAGNRRDRAPYSRLQTHN